MTPAARLAAAAELLHEIEVAATPAEQHVSAFFRARRYAGSKDRRWITEFVYRCLRRLGELDWAVTRSGAEPTARLEALMALILFEGVTPEAIAADYFGGTHGLAGLEPEEQAVLTAAASLDLADMPVEAAGNFPKWIADKLAEEYGAAAPAVMAAYQGRGPVTLRVNRLKATRDDILAILADEGIEAAPTALSPDGITLESRINLSRHILRESGRIELQDEAAQISARLADAAVGMQVIDFCAGSGGKSLAMAAGMNYDGQIHALDTDAKRMRDLAKRANRAGVELIAPLLLHEDERDDELLGQLAGSADRVFVDAPCSGAGTWRRQPDQKWKLTPERLEELCALQRHILGRAAPLVVPGGRLIYATCSILAQENQAQVDDFLSSHPDFHLVPVSSLWAEVGLDGRYEGDCLALTPADHGTDGFFTAVLEKADPAQ